MNPASLAKNDTESGHQKALFAYAAIAALHGFEVADLYVTLGDLPTAKDRGAHYEVPQLVWFHAIPNGGSRGDNKKAAMIRGAQLRAEGVRKGVADTFLPVPNQTKAGLYIEMKKPSQKPKTDRGAGGLSKDQIAFRDFVVANHYEWHVCYHWQEAVAVLKQYLSCFLPK